MASHFVTHTLRRISLHKQTWKIFNHQRADFSRIVTGGFIKPINCQLNKSYNSYAFKKDWTTTSMPFTISSYFKPPLLPDSILQLSPQLNHCRNFTWKGKVPPPPPPHRCNVPSTIEKDDATESILPPANLGLFARFKMMYKQYWYVLVPVHVVTSTGWLLGFYYLSKR